MDSINSSGMFDKFHFARLSPEPDRQLYLEGTSRNEFYSKNQRSILSKLEEGMPLYSAAAFQHHVNFQRANSTPVQRWYPYREGYSTTLVEAFINELEITGPLFDPFSGSGTSLLASRIQGIDSFGVEINPVSVLVSKAENEQYTRSDLAQFTDCLTRIRLESSPSIEYSTLFPLAAKVFNDDILQSLLHFKELINSVGNLKVRQLLFLAWMSIIEGVSNIKKEGNGIKYKNRKRTKKGYIEIDKTTWENKTFPEDKFTFVKDQLLKKLSIIQEDLEENYGSSIHKPVIFHANSLNFNDCFSEEIDLTFFSPPYCNCFDYFEIHKVELWLGDFLESREDLKKMRRNAFRSNTNSLSDKKINYINPALEELISLFDLEKMWSKKIPDVIRGYFDDMNMLMEKLFKQTKKGGFVGIVIGNSAYSSVIIPTDLLIADIARENRFKVKKLFVTRHLTTSSQQKKKLESLRGYLRESIVLLER